MALAKAKHYSASLGTGKFAVKKNALTPVVHRAVHYSAVLGTGAFHVVGPTMQVAVRRAAPMASNVVLIDGFDWPDSEADLAARWASGVTFNSTNYTVSTSSGNYGGGGVKVIGTSNATTPVFQSKAWQTAILHTLIGFWFKMTEHGPYTVSNEKDFIQIRTAATIGLSISYDPNNDAMKLWNGGNGVTQLGSTATKDLADGNWHYFEWKVFSSATVGTSEVRIDGVAITNLTVSGANTLHTITPNLLYLGPNFRTAGEFTDVIFDDVSVIDWSGGAITDFQGGRRIWSVYPTGDSTVQYTPDTGATNFSQVNKQPLSTTHNVHDSTSGHQDLYSTGGSPSATINAVQANAIGKLTSGTSNTQSATIKSSSTTSQGGNVNMAATIGWCFNCLDLDPNGSIAWTATSVNACLHGQKVQAVLGAGVATIYNSFLEVMTAGSTAYVATLGAGTFTLTGEALTAPAARLASLGKGTFTLTGEPLAPGKNAAAALGTGSFALTGEAMAGVRTILASLGKGTFVVTGEPLTVPIVRNPAVLGTGVFVVTGEPLTPDMHRVTTLGVGNFTVTGRALTKAVHEKLGNGVFQINSVGAQGALLIQVTRVPVPPVLKPLKAPPKLEQVRIQAPSLDNWRHSGD